MKPDPVTTFDHESGRSLRFNFRVAGSAPAGPVRHAIGRCSEGMLLVARSRHGVCAIFLGEDAQGLRDELAAAFPGAELTEDAGSLDRDLRQVAAFVDGAAVDGVIELDIGGTAFQQKVWQVLRGIPPGQTRSYGELARDLGMPEATRAVAGACAANLLAIAVPCHRVVRSDGSISGYRWGSDRKRALLAKERR